MLSFKDLVRLTVQKLERRNVEHGKTDGMKKTMEKGKTSKEDILNNQRQLEGRRNKTPLQL